MLKFRFVLYLEMRAKLLPVNPNFNCVVLGSGFVIKRFNIHGTLGKFSSSRSERPT